MNFDDFETKLRHVPRRQPPAEWRKEILAPLQQRDEAVELAWWRRWLWPHPIAWAVMAMLWVTIAGLQFAAAPPEGVQTSASLPKSPDIRHALEERIRMMAELSGDATRARTYETPADRPRSSCRNREVVV
jgi:hypothetical protein